MKKNVKNVALLLVILILISCGKSGASKNEITLNNLQNIEQNMGYLLDVQSTICYKNCDDIKLTIKSKINHLVINNHHITNVF